MEWKVYCIPLCAGTGSPSKAEIRPWKDSVTPYLHPFLHFAFVCTSCLSNVCNKNGCIQDFGIVGMTYLHIKRTEPLLILLLRHVALHYFVMYSGIVKQHITQNWFWALQCLVGIKGERHTGTIHWLILTSNACLYYHCQWANQKQLKRQVMAHKEVRWWVVRKLSGDT